jgi:hypothetical protein
MSNPDHVGFDTYAKRYMKINDDKNVIINGQHQLQESFEDINSFYLISDSINLCLNFKHKLLNQLKQEIDIEIIN